MDTRSAVTRRAQDVVNPGYCFALRGNVFHRSRSVEQRYKPACGARMNPTTVEWDRVDFPRDVPCSRCFPGRKPIYEGGADQKLVGGQWE